MKRLTILTALVGFAPHHQSTGATLTHHWRLDEASGTTAVDSVGNLNGTLHNFDTTPAWQNPGLEFERLGQINAGNDRIDGFSGALTVGGGGFSITAWITPDVIDTSQFASEWVFAQRSGGVDRSQWGLEEGKLWGGKNDFTGKGTTTLVSGTQYFVVYTFDGRDARGYLDGELEYTAPNTYSPAFDNQANAIGSNLDSNFGFDGVIYDLRTYDGALDEGEIQELFDAGPIGAGLPSFTSDPLVKPDAESGQAYSGPTLAGDVVDWDSPPENLEFAKVSGPDWLTVTADGTLSGTPGPTDGGLNTWTVTVTDGTNTTEAELQITVTGAGAPTFTMDPIAKPDAATGESYGGQSLAGDADDSDTPPENLEFAKVDGPDWLTVASSGDFSGTPGQDDIGLNIWTVSVSDGAGVDQAQLEITVFQPPGLVHHWPFLETSGTTAVDVVGGFDGNLLNFDDPPGTDSGWTGNGLQFDGDNDRIVGIEGAVSPAGYTISAWVTPDSFGGENWIIVQRDGSGDRSQWGFRQNGRINGGKNDFEGLGTTNLEIGAEQFVAFTYDGLDTIRGYLNGEEEYSRGGNSYSPGFDSIPNTIGAFPDDNFNFDGLIRDLRIYDTALPQPEIQALFAAGPTGSEPPAVVITDLSHNSDSGEIRISWESNEGLLYNLRGETDPSAAEPLDWPIFDGLADIEATPPENTLTLPLPAESLRLFVVEAFPAPPEVVFSDDFESGQGDWTVGSDGAEGTAWELGAPSNVGPAAANSPANCFGTNLSADHGTDADVWLRSPPIDLTSAVGATLSYFQFTDIEEGFDSGKLSVLDAADNTELAVLQELEGVTGGWEHVKKSFPPATVGKTVRLEFRLQSDDLQNFAGWYLDDVEVTVP